MDSDVLFGAATTRVAVGCFFKPPVFYGGRSKPLPYVKFGFYKTPPVFKLVFASARYFANAQYDKRLSDV